MPTFYAIEASCWGCGKKYDIMYLPIDARARRCKDCGGFVVSPSGKVQIRLITEKEYAEKLPKLY